MPTSRATTTLNHGNEKQAVSAALTCAVYTTTSSCNNAPQTNLQGNLAGSKKQTSMRLEYRAQRGREQQDEASKQAKIDDEVVGAVLVSLVALRVASLPQSPLALRLMAKMAGAILIRLGSLAGTGDRKASCRERVSSPV